MDSKEPLDGQLRKFLNGQLRRERKRKRDSYGDEAADDAVRQAAYEPAKLQLDLKAVA